MMQRKDNEEKKDGTGILRPLSEASVDKKLIPVLPVDKNMGEGT